MALSPAFREQVLAIWEATVGPTMDGPAYRDNAIAAGDMVARALKDAHGDEAFEEFTTEHGITLRSDDWFPILREHQDPGLVRDVIAAAFRAIAHVPYSNDAELRRRLGIRYSKSKAEAALNEAFAAHGVPWRYADGAITDV